MTIYYLPASLDEFEQNFSEQLSTLIRIKKVFNIKELTTTFCLDLRKIFQKSLDILEKPGTQSKDEIVTPSERYKLSSECRPLLEKYTNIKWVDAGAVGDIFRIYRKNEYSWKYVMKTVFIPENKKKSSEEKIKEYKFAEEEMKISRLMGEENIGPEVIDTISCSAQKFSLSCSAQKFSLHNQPISGKIYIVVMEKMEMTLRHFSDKYLELYLENYDLILEEIRQLYRKMWNKGVEYEDLHVDNVMINLQGEKISKIRIIDFGGASLINQKELTDTQLDEVIYEIELFGQEIMDALSIEKGKFHIRQAKSGREIKIHHTLSKHGLAPKIIKIEGKDLYLEKFPYTLGALLAQKKLTSQEKKQLAEKIREKIKRMHSLDLAHGDLHEDNIVVKQEKGTYIPYLIDFEESFYISRGQTNPKVIKWMKEKFSWEGSYQEFVQNNYENWSLVL